MTAKDILNLIRGAIRPFISVTGWGVFLVVAVKGVLRKVVEEEAEEAVA